MHDSSVLLRATQLHKRFDSKAVLNGVDLTVRRGQVVGLLGSNGSGKTTLIKCLLGLLRPTSGTAELLGDSSWDLSAAAKERLGYVPQEMSLLPWMTVASHVAYVGAFYQHWQPARVDTLVRNWGLEPSQRIGKLSVGQRQRLASILALGHDPELLILDEPVASLDPGARRQFVQELIEIGQDERHAVLFSTHIMSDVERVASHVAIMIDGVVAYFGELDAIKERFQRVRLSRSTPFDADFTCPEAVRVHRDGTHAVLTIDREQVDPAALAMRYGAEVKVDDMNLEEIFLELCGPGAPVERISEMSMEAGR